MAETIKDFLVGLGFSVDSSSERKFSDAIRSATLQADLLARGLEGAAVAIAKAVAQISSGFESIYYTAQRANTSVSNLRSMTYALSQLGTSAGSAQSSLSNFGRRLATDPGAESMLKAIGVRTRDAAGRLRDTTRLFEEFGRATAKMPTYVAIGYAQQLGVDEDTMRAMREQPELLAKMRIEHAEMARSMGIDLDDSSRKGTAFMQSLRRLEAIVTLVAEKILGDLAPAMKAFVDQVIEWVRQNPDAIRDGLAQIGDAAMAFAKACIAIAKELAPVIAKIGELAASITGHGGLQGTLELMAAFMVGSWALRIVGAITSVSTAWGALMLRLGIPILTTAGGAIAGALAVSAATDKYVPNAEKPGVITRSDDENTGAADAGGMFDAARRAWRAGKRMLGGGGAEAHNRDDGISGRGGAGIRQRAARATEIDKTNYNFSGENADVLKQAAKEIGTSPKDLATVISYETGGKFSPSIRGGKNNKYIGLIQFGPSEQRDYGANQQQSFKEQMPAVVRYLKHRGFKPGMSLNQLYATINGGRPDKNQNASDGNGTIAQHVERMKASHGLRADRFLASGTQQPDLAGAAKGLGKLMSEEDKAAAAKAVETEAQADVRERERVARWNEVYKATGDAAKADEAARKISSGRTAPKAPTAAGEAPAAPEDKPAPRRPTFSPAFGADKAPPLAGPTNNSRSASLTQNNTFNVQGGDPRQTADLVAQGQKTVGTFGLEGIKSAIR